MNWPDEHVIGCGLSKEHEGYVLGRGGREDTVSKLRLFTWEPTKEPVPDETFRKKYGPHGEWLTGWLLWPLCSPRGRIIGLSGRRVADKTITRYLFPEAEWNPLWVGLTPETMRRTWDGSDVWIVEGLFDLLPLEWAAPEKDVVLGSERAQLTDKHVEFLRRFCKGRVRMTYDNDDAGRKGTHDWTDETGKKRWGALRRLGKAGVDVVAVNYRGKDPGEVWRQGGAAAMRTAFVL